MAELVDLTKEATSLIDELREQEIILNQMLDDKDKEIAELKLEINKLSAGYQGAQMRCNELYNALEAERTRPQTTGIGMIVSHVPVMAYAPTVRRVEENI